ncbi:hypothetical protein [Natronocalculus amylovorans]|uniref:Uncharacterized protein n=1 Tax=Natronocalculus amylovorans TaxID=2917812 RepID=A0AAE3FYR5_9EURY|nr:hypothetical protein [Natronocalculus amylovorans]MCL9817771.1 hypothetical protein [Natronocalculus amylovorans]
MTDTEFVPLILNNESAAQWEVVYSSIQDGQVTDDALKDGTGLSGIHIEEALKGLAAMRLINDRNEPYEENPLIEIDDVSDSIRYRLTGLQGLMDEHVPDNWGRHAGVLLHYEYLVEEREQYFRDDDEGLWKKIRNWEEDRGYEPKKKNGDNYQFNTKKWTHWTVIADHLGLIRKTKGSFYTTYFDPEILRGTLLWYSDKTGTYSFPISKYINWLDENVVPCPTQGNTVPVSISHTLHLLSRTGWLNFVEEGDSATASLAGIEPSQYPDSVNSISIIKS